MEQNQNTIDGEQTQALPGNQENNHSDSSVSETLPVSPQLIDAPSTLSTEPQTTGDIFPDEPQTETMEVHKHPHHVTHKKNWVEYVLEFFMLFLAVFLGFIAENIREHFVENRRAKEYAQSLYDDLRKDSAFLKRIVDLKHWRGIKLDSLMRLLKDPAFEKNTREVYYYSLFVNTDLPFKPNDVTIQQLRNSGTLRYFPNIQLYNSITEYYNNCNFYMDRENEGRQMVPPMTLTSKIFNTVQLLTLSVDPPPVEISEAVHAPAADQEFAFLSTDSQLWNEYALYVFRQKARNGLSLMLLQKIQKSQTELMSELENEYDVK